ncbi:hypothetical protein VR44_22785 [Streptomyces katrae]|uniref:Uncharacterized protein n=1 Tax=Streptomyces katrae TaxID=68223 RepID=A0A0F4J6Q1_9ACTN|nr:hypothetical protein VR44_22785 [Streptomyces katrae]
MRDQGQHVGPGVREQLVRPAVHAHGAAAGVVAAPGQEVEHLHQPTPVELREQAEEVLDGTGEERGARAPAELVLQPAPRRLALPARHQPAQQTGHLLPACRHPFQHAPGHGPGPPFVHTADPSFP